MSSFKSIIAAVLCLTTSFASAQRSTPVEVVHPSGSLGGLFGGAIAVDGDTMVIGAWADTVGGAASRGSAHVYRWSGTGWAFEATLQAVGIAAGDYFGTSVAISGDTAIVGSNGDDVAANGNQGSAYVFVRAGSTWMQQAKLLASDGAAGDTFGCSVAVDGDTAIVGARFDSIGIASAQGSAYVFTRSGSTWTQQSKLTAVAGAAGDNFGMSVAIDGDTAVVGADYDDVNANVNQGSAYVFTRSSGTWSQQAQLIAGDGAPLDYFGRSLALSGDTVLVAADEDDVGGAVDQGSVYVFTRSGASWTQQARLTASDGVGGDRFGLGVAIVGDTAVVGAGYDAVGANFNQGSAYVFARVGSTWSQQTQVTSMGDASDLFGLDVALSGDTLVVGAPGQDAAWVLSRVGSRWIGSDQQLPASGGGANDNAGYSVAIDGDTAVVAAVFDDVGAAVDQGSVSFYTRFAPGAAWRFQSQVTVTGVVAGDLFGSAVAIDGDTAVVAAASDDVGVNANQGSVFVFRRSGSIWSLATQLTASGGAANDYFGQSVALDGDTIVVGANLDDVGVNADQGSAYVFGRSGATWIQLSQLTASGGAAADRFGTSVAIDGDSIIVGANYDDVAANANQGSAFVFLRTGGIWTQQGQLAAADGVANDQFGVSVALSGDTAIVGAYFDDVGSNANQGSAYAFIRSGGVWTQQSRLVASGGAADDQFGTAVAIDGDVTIVGADGDDVGSSINAGSASVFVRSGATWLPQGLLTAAGGMAGDAFGRSVAFSRGTAVVGAVYDDVGANVDQGSAWTFDVLQNDLAAAHNDVTDAAYGSVSAATLPASTGHQIAATEGAWRRVTVLDTAGRSIVYVGQDDIRTTSQSIITLGGSSSMLAPEGAVIDLNGQLRVNGYGDLYADAFRLGSRGVMTSRTNASLTINAPTATIDGQTRVEQAASLTASGDWTNIGPVALSQDASFAAGGLLRNIDTWTMSAGARASAGTAIDNRATWTVTAGELHAPVFTNLGEANIFGASAVFGDFTNATGATTTIRSGTLFVFGDLTNNGTVIGTICSTCSGLPPSMDVGGTLSLGPAANLTMPFVGSTVHLGGSFDCAIEDNSRFDMAQATLQLESARPEVTLEVMSLDIGADVAGLDRSVAGRFPIGELHIGGHPTTVRLVDVHDNALNGFRTCEALYVDTLRLDRGSRLVNTTCRIYYNTLINDGTVDVPENLIPLEGTPCPADFNMDGGVDGGDVVDFFAAWEAGESTADVNQDGGVDGGDIDVFFAAWEAGGC